MKVYDFVFVGSGMGALVAADILGRKGYSILILEKNQQLGGSLQTFSRDKKLFDTGVHYIGSLDDGENLNQIFKYLGIRDALKLSRLDDDAFDVIRFPGGQEYKLGQGYDQFKKNLIESFPNEREAIELFCNKVQEICEYFPLYNLDLDSEKNYLNDPSILELGAYEYISSITSDESLIGVLLGNGPLYAGERDTTPMYVLALILNSYISGSYRLISGGSQLTKVLVSNIRKHKGELLKRSKVVKANYSEGEIVSVETENGNKYFGKNFISNLHPRQTLEVFGEEYFKPAYRRRIKNVEDTISCFSLYVSFKEDCFPYLNFNVYDYFVEPKKAWDVLDYEEETWPQVLFTCTGLKKGQGEFADSLSVLAYMKSDEVENWSNTFNTVVKPGERGESYKNFKREKEEKVIQRLEERYPNIRSCIDKVYSSTPLTYKDYIGTSDGSLYGIKKDKNRIAASIINSKTKVPNLFLTGQNIIFHGVLGATIGALVTCFNFIPQEELIEEIKNA